MLQNGEQELEWLTSHPLWLPTPLAPLFKALRWQPAEVAYLIGAILTDQKVLLHSEDAHKLYMSVRSQGAHLAASSTAPSSYRSCRST